MSDTCPNCGSGMIEDDMLEPFCPLATLSLWACQRIGSLREELAAVRDAERDRIADWHDATGAGRSGSCRVDRSVQYVCRYAADKDEEWTSETCDLIRSLREELAAARDRITELLAVATGMLVILEWADQGGDE